MDLRARFQAWLALFAVALAGGCAIGAADDCDRGTLGCACFPDGGCEYGLSCAGTMCVSPGLPGTDESSSDDGTDEGPQTTMPPSETTAPSPAYCGDAACDPGEDCAWCPEDCGACAEQCGDDACTPSESCDACPEDCGECCGDGQCDPALGEGWPTCWSDCSAGAPLLPLADLHGGCAGATEIEDDTPSTDWLWVHATSGALMYVDGDTVVEITDSDVQGNEVTIEGMPFARIGCHQTGANSCAPTLLMMSHSDCYGSTYSVADVTSDGTGLSVTTTELFSPCDTLCGNGTCDPHEVESACWFGTNLPHVCLADCGEYQGPCETPVC